MITQGTPPSLRGTKQSSHLDCHATLAVTGVLDCHAIARSDNMLTLIVTEMKKKVELESFPHITYEFKEIANAMQFTFFKNSSETNVGVNVGVNEVYDYIKNNQPTKANQIAKHFPDITQRTIERYIKQLKDEYKIIFKGSPKTGGYIVK